MSTQCWSVLIATITTGLGIYYVWTLFVSGFGLYANFVDLKSELQRSILACLILIIDTVISWYGLLDPLTTVAVQTFYLERAYTLNGRAIWTRILVIPIM